MLLLLFAGGGSQAPITDGVRAYAVISYSNVNDTGSSLALVNPTSDSLTATTNALPTEE